MGFLRASCTLAIKLISLELGLVTYHCSCHPESSLEQRPRKPTTDAHASPAERHWQIRSPACGKHFPNIVGKEAPPAPHPLLQLRLPQEKRNRIESKFSSSPSTDLFFFSFFFLVENMLLENLVVTEMFPLSEIPRLYLVSRNFVAGTLTISLLCSWPQRKVY